MTSVHAQAFDLARRHSMKNENDLLQENLFEDDSFSSVTENYCSSLLEKHTPVGIDLPHECNKFASFKATLQRRNSEREDANIAFAGMNPHEALEAMRARDHGRPHTAKIQRRLTNPKKSETTWF